MRTLNKIRCLLQQLLIPSWLKWISIWKECLRSFLPCTLGCVPHGSCCPQMNLPPASHAPSMFMARQVLPELALEFVRAAGGQEEKVFRVADFLVFPQSSFPLDTQLKNMIVNIVCRRRSLVFCVFLFIYVLCICEASSGPFKPITLCEQIHSP